MLMFSDTGLPVSHALLAVTVIVPLIPKFIAVEVQETVMLLVPWPDTMVIPEGALHV
jgi:hypothetical protein